MRKVVIIFFATSLIFYSCKHHLSQDLKEQAIMKIKVKLLNPQSYSPVSWGEIDTSTRAVGNDREGKRIRFVIDSLEKINVSDTSLPTNATGAEIERLYKHGNDINDQITDLRKQYVKLITTSKKEQVGWYLKHQCKVVGKLGTVEFRDFIIDINMDLTRVDSVEDLTELNKFMNKLN